MRYELYRYYSKQDAEIKHLWEVYSQANIRGAAPGNPGAAPASIFTNLKLALKGTD